MDQNQPQQQLQPDSSVSPVQKPDDQSKSSSIFFRRFLIGMFTFYLLFGLTVLTVWIVVHPLVPVFELDHASVSNLTIINNNITGTWKLGFRIRNPNKKIRVSYENITFTVYYAGDAPLASAIVPSLDQEPRTASVRGSSFAGSYDLGNLVYIGEQLIKERKEGSVHFDAKMRGSVAFGLEGWSPRRRSLEVECGDVMLYFPPNATSGEMPGAPQECSVEF